ncbi:MAG: hypothetical protein ACLU5J_11015 [Christensenellales bacterium]
MIIVGLGNVGKEYENTHHNAGFLALDSIAKANQLEFRLEKNSKPIFVNIYIKMKNIY